MAHLTLTGVSADGRRLLLVSAKGVEFTLDINPALKAALRGDTAPLGQLEIPMNSSLRPREIQNRIRAGESPDAVADAAGTTVQAIMAYVGPVVAERQHVADRAQRASLRRGAGEGPSPSRVLGDTVAARLRDLGADPSLVEWDAYRRETGRWMLTAEFTTGARAGTAQFTFDPPGNYTLCDNDDARWLVGDLPEESASAAADNDLDRARQRRLQVLPDGADELPLGDDALDLVSDAPPPAEPAPTDAQPERAQPERVQPERAQPEPERADAETAQADGEPEEAPQRRPVQKKRGRASVPSWDEIMFGGGDK